MMDSSLSGALPALFRHMASGVAPGEDPSVDPSTHAQAAQGLGGVDDAKVAAMLKDLADVSDAASVFLASLNEHPELPAVNAEPFDGLTGEDLMAYAENAIQEVLDKISKMDAGRIVANKDRLAGVNQEKLEKLMEKIKKDADATPGLWGKVFGWVTKALTAITAAVAVVAGLVMMFSGAGILFGAALLSLGAYMGAGVTVEAINAVREEKGLDPLDFSPTLGYLAGKLAEWGNADEDTVKKVKAITDALTDIVVGIAVGVMLPGVGTAMAAKKAGSAFKGMQAVKSAWGRGTQVNDLTQALQMKKVGLMASKGASAFQSAVGVAKGGYDIGMADKRYDAAMVGAELKKVMANLTRLQAIFDLLAEDFKDLEKKRGDSIKRCSDTVASEGQAKAEVVANMMPMA